MIINVIRAKVSTVDNTNKIRQLELEAGCPLPTISVAVLFTDNFINKKNTILNKTSILEELKASLHDDTGIIAPETG